MDSSDDGDNPYDEDPKPYQFTRSAHKIPKMASLDRLYNTEKNTARREQESGETEMA